MFIGQCDYCGEAFSGAGSKICSKCAKELDGYFAQIRNYLYATPGDVTPSEITEALGIPEKAVVYLIDSGKLISDKKLAYAGKCSICGRPARTGQMMCDDCNASVRGGINKYRSDRAAMEDEHLKQSSQSRYIQPMRTRGKEFE